MQLAIDMCDRLADFSVEMDAWKTLTSSQKNVLLVEVDEFYMSVEKLIKQVKALLKTVDEEEDELVDLFKDVSLNPKKRSRKTASSYDEGFFTTESCKEALPILEHIITCINSLLESKK